MAWPLLMLCTVLALGLAAERLGPVERPAGAERLRATLAYAFCNIGGSLLAGQLARIAPALGLGGLGVGLIDLPPSGWGLLWALPAYVLLMDLAEFGFHRAQHAWPFLWAMHSLHHSARPMNAATTLRHYWLEPAIKAVFLYPLVALVLNANATVVLLYALLNHWHFACHLNLRLPMGPFWAVINNPDYHRLHHSSRPEHFNRNFAALFPLYDLLCGTACRPAAGACPETGLDSGAVPAGPVDALLWPLRRRPAAANQGKAVAGFAQLPPHPGATLSQP